MTPPEDTPSPAARRFRALRWLVAATFLAGGLLTVHGDGRWNSDERFYTDGALLLLENGDLLVPRWATGEPRFNKPPLTTWVAALPAALFGPGFLAFRALFVLAGAWVVLETGRVARDLLRCERTGLFASLVMAANVEIFVLATRATPDILLVLGVTLLGGGVARGLAGAPAGRAVGAGLAIALFAKGAVGLLAVVFAALLAFRHGGGHAVRRLLLTRWTTLAFLLAAAWFLAVRARHGEAFVTGFLGDQGGNAVNLHVALLGTTC